MILHILENNLRDFLGHFLNSTLGLKREAEARGVEVRVYTHRRARPEILRLVQGRALFDHGSWDGAAHPDAWRSMQDLGGDFARSCRRIQDLGAEDVILVPSASQDQIFGLALFLEGLPTERRPRVAVNFHSENWERRSDRAAPYKQACQRLVHALTAERFLLTATARAVADSLSELVDHPARWFPLPQDYGTSTALDVRPADAPPTVVVLGRSRPSKGGWQLPRVVLMVRRRLPEARFFVQVTGKMQLLAFLSVIPGVKVHFGGQDRAAYFDCLRAADVVLLPYSAEAYARRSSGILADCAALGRIAVVPEGTWLSEQLHEGHAAGVTYKEANPEAIAEALVQAIRELPKLSVLARDRAEYWWKCQSASAFIDRLLAELSGDHQARPAF